MKLGQSPFDSEKNEVELIPFSLADFDAMDGRDYAEQVDWTMRVQIPAGFKMSSVETFHFLKRLKRHTSECQYRDFIYDKLRGAGALDQDLLEAYITGFEGRESWYGALLLSVFSSKNDTTSLSITQREDLLQGVFLYNADDLADLICKKLKVYSHYTKPTFRTRAAQTKMARAAAASIDEFLMNKTGESKVLSKFDAVFSEEHIEDEARDLGIKRAINPSLTLSVPLVKKVLELPDDQLDNMQLGLSAGYLSKRALNNATFREQLLKSGLLEQVLKRLRDPQDFLLLFYTTFDEIPELANFYRIYCRNLNERLADPSFFTVFVSTSLIGDGMEKAIKRRFELVEQFMKKASPLHSALVLEKAPFKEPIIDTLVLKCIKDLVELPNFPDLLARHLPLTSLIATRIPDAPELITMLSKAVLGKTGKTAKDRAFFFFQVSVIFSFSGNIDAAVSLVNNYEAQLALEEKQAAKGVEKTAGGVRRRALGAVGGDGAERSEAGRSDDFRSGAFNRPAAPMKKPLVPQFSGERVKTRPTLSEDGDFAKILSERFGNLGIAPELAVNVGVALNGVPSAIRSELMDVVGMAIDLNEWAEGEERKMATESDSILCRVGIDQVAVRRAADGFEIDVELDGRVFGSRVKVNELGEPESANFTNEPLIKAILELEGLRYLGELFGEKVTGAENVDVLRLLGLEEMPEVEYEEVSEEGAFDGAERSEAVNEGGLVGQPAPAEAKEVIEGRNFLLENWEAFEKFIQELGQKLDLKSSFEVVQRALTQFAAGIQVDKALPSLGVTVEMEGGHVLTSFVKAVDIYDPEITREIIKGLGVDATSLHVESIDKVDAYFVRLNVKMGGKDEQISACILSPTLDIYYFGVDPQELLENETVEALHLNHFILKAFKMAVMRDDDPDFRRAKSHKGGSGRTGAGHVNSVITKATKSSYPPIVTSWKTKNEEGGEADKGQMSGLKKIKDGERGVHVQRILKELTLSDEIEKALVRIGTRVQGVILQRVLGGDAYPHPGVYVPVREEETMKALLEAYKNERLVRSKNPDDDWFEDAFTRPETDEEDAILALAFALSNPGKAETLVHPALRSMVYSKFKGEKAFESMIRAFLAENPDISILDFYNALKDMSPMNPDDIKLLTSEACGYHLPYLFRKDASKKPEEVLFEDGFEVGSGLSMEVVKIIAGNRVSMSNVSDVFLMGAERSEAMNYAAKLHNRMEGQETEVDLRPRARALMVWEFEGENGEMDYAFAYLDTAREALDPSDLSRVMPAEERLKKFPSVYTAIERAKRENASGKHTDFEELWRFNENELERLEQRGLFKLKRGKDGSIIGIVEGSIKPIRRKKIAIMTNEQVGYKQFRFKPETFVDYMEFADNEGLLSEQYHFDEEKIELQRRIFDFFSEKS